MKFIAAVALATTLMTAMPAAAAVVFSEDFSGYGSSTVTNAADSLFAGNWKTTSGFVDYLAAGDIFSDLCSGGGSCIDLDGSQMQGGTFETIQTFANGLFTVLFQFTGSNRADSGEDSLTVSFGGMVGTVTKFFNEVGNQDDFGVLFTNVAVGALGTTLSFTDNGSDNQGMLLKSVTVEKVAPIPVPAAGGLLVLALGGLAALRRRKAALV